MDKHCSRLVFVKTGEQRGVWGKGDYGWGDHACGPQISAAPSSVTLISSLPLTGDTGKISLISLSFFKKSMYVHVCIFTCMFVCVCT